MTEKERVLQPSFALREIKDGAFVLTKKHWRHYVLLGLVSISAICFIELLQIVIADTFEMRASESMLVQGVITSVSTVLSLISTGVQIYFSLIFARYALFAAEDKSVPFKEYFSWNGKQMLSMLGAMILFGVAVIGGSILFIVPGIIFGIAFSAYAYVLVEKKTGAIEALARSWRITKGNRWRIFVFKALSACVAMALMIIPLIVIIMPLMMEIEYSKIIIAFLGVLFAVWALGVGIAFSTFGTIASALMYKKMMATRKSEE